MKNTNWLLLIVVILVIVTIGFIFVSHHHYAFFEEKNRDTLILESAKTLLQLTGIAALGGWIKFLYDKATEQRRQAEKANEMRKALLDDLIAARSLVEEARRIFRVEATSEQYKKTILTILDARLKLSRIWNETESLEFLFSNHKKITKCIKAMKDYLDPLIREYENSFSASSEKDSAAGINAPVFKEFLSDDQKSDYIKDFLEGAYRPAVKEIRKDLLQANRANFSVEN